MVDLYDTLQYFMQAPSVTGFEQQRRERIIEVFSKYCDTVSVDVMGKLIAYTVQALGKSDLQHTVEVFRR